MAGQRIECRYAVKKNFVVIKIETIFWLKAKAKWNQQLDSYCLKKKNCTNLHRVGWFQWILKNNPAQIGISNQEMLGPKLRPASKLVATTTWRCNQEPMIFFILLISTVLRLIFKLVFLWMSHDSSHQKELHVPSLCQVRICPPLHY